MAFFKKHFKDSLDVGAWILITVLTVYAIQLSCFSAVHMEELSLTDLKYQTSLILKGHSLPESEKQGLEIIKAPKALPSL